MIEAGLLLGIGVAAARLILWPLQQRLGRRHQKRQDEMVERLANEIVERVRRGAGG